MKYDYEGARGISEHALCQRIVISCHTHVEPSMAMQDLMHPGLILISIGEFKDVKTQPTAHRPLTVAYKPYPLITAEMPISSLPLEVISSLILLP